MKQGTIHTLLRTAALSSLIYALPAMADPQTQPVPGDDDGDEIVTAPVLVPAAPPAPIRAVTKDYGPIPEPKPLPPITDKKARKDAIKEEIADLQFCLSNKVQVASLSEHGLKRCDEALAVESEPGTPWQRRALLLQSRALYLLALGQPEKALESLAESDARAKPYNDPLFDGSTGTGNGMLRAVALAKLDRKDEAMAEITRLRALRPYATVISRPLDLIEASLNPDIDAELARWTGKVKWQPNMLRMLIPLYIWRGDLANASRLVDQVSLVDPKPEGGWTISGTLSDAQQFQEEMRLQSWRAYIWAGVGNDELAGKILADGYAKIADYIGEPPQPRVKGEKVSKGDTEKYQARLRTGTDARETMSGWEKAIALRRSAQNRLPDDVMKEFDTLGKGTSIAMGDILGQVRSDDKRAEDAIKAVLDIINKQLSIEVLSLPMSRLAEALPQWEYIENVPKYKWGEKGGLFSGPNHSQSKEKNSDIRTVRYAADTGTPALAEELALMSVAEYAEREGKDSFILLARREVKRSITHCFYGCGPATDAGYESQARVVLLDSANVPEEWAAYRDRIVPVAQIKADLKPRYDGYEGQKAAIKAAEKAAKARK